MLFAHLASRYCLLLVMQPVLIKQLKMGGEERNLAFRYGATRASSKGQTIKAFKHRRKVARGLKSQEPFDHYKVGPTREAATGT